MKSAPTGWSKNDHAGWMMWSDVVKMTTCHIAAGVRGATLDMDRSSRWRSKTMAGEEDVFCCYFGRFRGISSGFLMVFHKQKRRKVSPDWTGRSWLRKMFVLYTEWLNDTRWEIYREKKSTSNLMLSVYVREQRMWERKNEWKREGESMKERKRVHGVYGVLCPPVTVVTSQCRWKGPLWHYREVIK